MQGRTLKGSLVERTAQDFLDGKITFGAIARLPLDLQEQIHNRIIGLTVGYRELDRQRKAASNITDEGTLDLCPNSILFNVASGHHERFVDNMSINNDSFKVSIGQSFQPGDEFEMISINEPKQYMTVVQNLTYPNFSPEEQAELLGQLRQDHADVLDQINDVEDDEDKDENIDGIFADNDLQLKRTTLHPFYVIYDDPVQSSVEVMEG